MQVCCLGGYLVGGGFVLRFVVLCIALRGCLTAWFLGFGLVVLLDGWVWRGVTLVACLG